MPSGLGISMLTSLWVLLCLLLALHAYREYWRNRDLPQIYTGEFEGELMKAGTTYIARRPARNDSQRTIVCFPGFLEDMRYFQELYEEHDAELILCNNANYHCPFPVDNVTQLGWPENPHAIGTIEYDAFYLGLALEHLVTGREVCLHGHSRGGAVVLDAGRQYPELTNCKERPVSAILEAPVLPQARTPGNTSDALPHRIQCYFLPIFFGLSRNISTERLLKMPMMCPTTPLKTHICSSIFSVSRSYASCVTNVKSIVYWQRTTAYEVYRNFPSLIVVIGARDSSLDRRSMLASAKQGQNLNSGLSILQTEHTNHFISLEQPDTIRAIH
jgi:pimeloyl-ACP methyl ester carboxylesterase